MGVVRAAAMGGTGTVQGTRGGTGVALGTGAGAADGVRTSATILVGVGRGMLCAMAVGGAGRGLARLTAMGGMRMGTGAAPWACIGAADGARGGAAMKLRHTSSATREWPWIGTEGRTGGWRGEGGLQGAG